MEPMLREFAFPQSVHWPKPAARQQQPGIRIDSPGSRNKDKNDPASAHSRRRGVVRGLCGHFTAEGGFHDLAPKSFREHTHFNLPIPPLPLLCGAGMPSRDGGSTALAQVASKTAGCQESIVFISNSQHLGTA